MFAEGWKTRGVDTNDLRDGTREEGAEPVEHEIAIFRARLSVPHAPLVAPLKTESAVTPSPRETAGAVRSAHVAHFLPADWARVAQLALPALERLTAEATGTQLLLLVPDANAATALARALAPHASAHGHRVVAATTPARARRLLGAGPAPVVIGAPAVIAEALAASLASLAGVTAVGFIAADELDPEDPALATVLAEVPKGASRWLTALAATPNVELLIERHLHKARRVTDDLMPAAEATASLTEGSTLVLTTVGAPEETLPLVLDEIDVPSTAVVTDDPACADRARHLVRSLGYTDGALVTVTGGEIAPNAALVIVLGLPSGSRWAAVTAAHPAQTVVVIAPRQQRALQQVVGAMRLQPFGAAGTIERARTAEARVRSELRTILSTGLPAREILALEPLLASHDGTEIAAAALRLLEQTRAAQNEVVQAAVRRVREQHQQQQEAARTAEREREPRGGRDGREGRDRGTKPGGFGARGPRSGPPRSAPPRGDGPRGDGPRGGPGRGGPGRGGPSRGDGPRGPRSGPPRGGPRSPR